MESANVFKILLCCLVTPMKSETVHGHPKECVNTRVCQYKEDAHLPKEFDVLCNSIDSKEIQRMLSCFGSAKNHKTLNKLSLSSQTSMVIEKGMFDGLHIFWLELANVSVMPEFTFKGVKWIKYVSLRQGNFTKILPAIQRLKSLRYLDLTDFNIEKLPEFVFQQLPLLERLMLKHCSIFEIHQKAFYGMRSLARLKLPENNLTAVPMESLQYLPRLFHLDLKDNQISELGLKAFQNLSSLYTLDLSGNRLSSISRMSFTGLSALTELFLNKNNISYLQKDVFAGLDKLEYIHLSENPLVHVDQDAMNQLNKIRTLSLRRTQISAIQEQSFTPLTELYNLDLAENYLTSVPIEAAANIAKLRKLDLRANHITELKPNSFAGLRWFNISDNQSTNLRNKTSLRLHTLYSLEISYNHITELRNNTFVGLENLQALNLIYNQISTVHKHAFAGIEGILQDLRLEGNNLTRIPVDALQNMTILDTVSFGSFIEYIEADTFKSFGKNIQLICLHGNRIKSLATAAFHHLPSLKELYLGNNQIHYLDFLPFQHFINDLWYLDISGNPVKCECELYWYVVANWKLKYRYKEFHYFYNATLEVCPQANITNLDQECKQKWKPILCNATSLYDCMNVDFCMRDSACCDQETYHETKVCMKLAFLENPNQYKKFINNVS